MKKLLTILFSFAVILVNAQTSSDSLVLKVVKDRKLQLHKLRGANVTIDTFYNYKIGPDTFAVDFKGGFLFAHDGIYGNGTDYNNKINRLFLRPRVKALQAIADTMQVIRATGTINAQNAVIKVDGSVIMKFDTLTNCIIDGPGNIQIFDSSTVLVNVRDQNGITWANWSGAHPSRSDNSPYWKKIVSVTDSAFIGLYPFPGIYSFSQPIVFKDQATAKWAGTRVQYTGDTTQAAITMGPETADPIRNRFKNHEFGWVIRSGQSAWSDSLNPVNAGIRWRNANSSTLYVDYISGFTCNLDTYGTNSEGFSYNHIYVNHFNNAYVAVWTHRTGTGWNNGNKFYGSRVNITTGVNTGKRAWGWIIGSVGGTYMCNGNRWDDGDYELGANRGVALVLQGINNIVNAKRDENNGEYIVAIGGASQENKFSFLYHGLNSKIKDTSTYGTGDFNPMANEILAGASSYPVYEWGAEGNTSQYNSTRNYFKGISFWNSSGVLTDSIQNATVKIFPDFVRFDASGALGVILDCSENKRYLIKAGGSGYRPTVQIYDANDSVITTTTHPDIKVQAAGTSMTYSSTFGGIFLPGATYERDFVLRLPDEAKKVRIAYARFSGSPIFKGMSISVIGPSSKYVQKYFGPTGEKRDVLKATAAPSTTGTYEKNTIIYNAYPSSGAAPGWICSSPGTFGPLTSAIGNIASSSAKLLVSGVSLDTCLFPGQYVDVNGSRFKILRRNGDTLFLNANPGSYSGSIDYYAATFIDWPGGSGGMTNPMTTAADIIVGGSGGTPQRLAKGTALQSIRVNSGATALEYYTPSTSNATQIKDSLDALRAQYKDISADTVVLNPSGDSLILQLKGNTYSPTYTNSVNTTAFTTHKAFYRRIGNVVEVDIIGQVTKTSSGTTAFTMSLPVPSNLTGTYDLWGTIGEAIHVTPVWGIITSETSSDQANITFTAPSDGVSLVTINFKYEVK